MPKISRLELKSAIMETIVSELHHAFLLLKDEGEALTFLNTLFTSTEITIFSKRLNIARMYLKGKNYHAIRDELKVSDSTIARISTKLSRNDVVKRVIKDLETIEQQRLQRTESEVEPMEKYLKTTRSLEKVLSSASTEAVKKIKQELRHRRIKSKLSKQANF